MKTIYMSLILGLAAAIIDITPMILKKMDRHAIISAFLQWIVLGFFIVHIQIPGVNSWLKGLIVALLASLPVLALVAKSEPNAIPVIVVMSAILGSAIGFASRYFIS